MQELLGINEKTFENYNKLQNNDFLLLWFFSNFPLHCSFNDIVRVMKATIIVAK